MYSSGYSQVSKYSPQAQKKMQYRSKGKSCGYYMRIVFFFSSLIQSLIIVSLVLFLIYGKKQDSASTSRIQDLEESFSRLSIENVALRHQRKNLTTLLNTTLTEKARNDWDLAMFRYYSNISAGFIQDLDKKLQHRNIELFICKSTQPGPCITRLDTCNCGLLTEELKARLQLVESNFTQKVHGMRMEMDQIAKERDNLNLEAIRLRRDKSTHEKALEFFRVKCKEDFTQSLSGVSNVTKAFLVKIDSLFPAHIAFQITCEKQREHLEQIRTNCSSLSREVEDRFQRYLNSVGEQVSSIQGENSRLKAENWRLSEDYRWCSQNRTGMIQQHRQSQDKLQRKNDEDKERLLVDKIKLNGEIEVLENNVRYKSKEVEHLAEQLKHLNMSCISRTGAVSAPRTGTNQPGWGFGGGGSSSASSSSSSGGQFGRTGSGSSSSIGSGFNKPASTGTGSSSTSLFSAGSSSSIGSGFNKPASTGTGSSSTSLFPAGSSSSIGSGFNKPALSGRGSSTIGSSSGSTGSSLNPSSSGTGLNKPVSNAKSSSSLGTSSGSTGSTSKSGSPFNWFGMANSNSGPSKTGTGTGKGTSSGTGFGGAGRTSGLGGGSVSVAQHLQDLQRLINPPVPEEKQDLSRMLG
ncbi:plasmalemma vesicle associated protein a isoform X4 [Morone saxatilis]|uniref:plasmalemma vesicle associated protein a isoform X3 n=1 Tax=Morone saxatilis TaxID=34816 RepID=UPI0015E1C237|nr:plasmalemma vesicle associated protein a isoform X3 [Morone saxatilis]XP_035526455.1 plasmalemma vesicle associated protein a isoform X4 [Morone saxatilis]